MYRLLAVLFFSFCSHYHVGVIERAAVLNHQPYSHCMVAALSEPLGTLLWLHSYTTGRSALCRVVDTVAAQDRAYHVAHHISIEIGYANIGALCGLSYYGQEPPSKCVVSYARISTARAVLRRIAWRSR